MHKVAAALSAAVAVLILVTVAALSGALHGSSRQGSTPRPASLARILSPLLKQHRLEIDQTIVHNLYLSIDYRIRSIAPDRLRTDMEGANVHVGDVGCLRGHFWICGPDSALHQTELRRTIMNELFPQNPFAGYCCLHQVEVVTGALPRTYVIRALGDPWYCPYEHPMCPSPGTHLPPITSEHYRAVLKVDPNGRPLTLDGTIIVDPTAQGRPRLVLQVPKVSFTYVGSWTVNLPTGRRMPCPSWDRTPGSWCVRIR